MHSKQRRNLGLHAVFQFLSGLLQYNERSLGADRWKSDLDANQADLSRIAGQNAMGGDSGICVLEVQLPLSPAILCPLQGPFYVLRKRCPSQKEENASGFLLIVHT